MSYGKTPAYSKRYEANFQSKESNSDAEILIQLLLDFKEKIDVPFLSHRKLKNHIMQSFSSTIWTYQNGAFEDDDTEFEDENGNLKYINDFSNFWTVHKQIDITINFFILKTLIHSLRLYYQTFTQGEKIFNSVICIKLIKEFPELTMIFCELFKHIIIPINQYLFITWDMTLLNFESYDDIKKSKINYVKEKKTSDISIETIGIENIKATTYESSYK